MDRIGLVAGAGEIPVIFASEARKRGAKVIGFAIKEIASPGLNKACDRVHWLTTKQIAKFFFLLVTERIKKIALLGKVEKSVVYSAIEENEGDLRRFKETEDKSDYTILDRVTDELKKKGVEVIDTAQYLSSLLPEKGVLTGREPSEKEKEDISFGFKIAKEIARLDIGQAVVVKDKSVVAVEAVEGTDRAIKRAAELGVKEFVVIKVSRPGQDMRWDVPVVGPDTVKSVIENRGKVLALEERSLFLVDRDACVKLADENGITIVVV